MAWNLLHNLLVLTHGCFDIFICERTLNQVQLKESKIVVESKGHRLETLTINVCDISHVQRQQMLSKHKSHVHQKPIEVHLAIQNSAPSLSSSHCLYFCLGLRYREFWIGYHTQSPLDQCDCSLICNDVYGQCSVLDFFISSFFMYLITAIREPFYIVVL